MTAAIRLARLYCTLFPLSRWLAWFALSVVVLIGIILTLGVVAASRGAVDGPPEFAVGLALLVLIFLMPALIAAGIALRFFAAPRSHRLLPGLRGQVLAAAFLILGTAIAAGIGLVVPAELARMLITSSGPQLAVLGWITLLIGTVGFVLIYFSFRLSRPGRFGAIETVVLIVVFFAGTRYLDPGELAAGTPWLMLLPLLAALIGFGVWYLKVPAIAPPTLRAELGRTAARRATASPAAMKETLLSGATPIGLWRGLATGTAAGITLGLMFAILGESDALDFADASPIELPIMIVMGFMSAMRAKYVGARARNLWLLGCGSRDALLHEVERTTAKLVLLVLALPVSMLVSWHYTISPIGGERLTVYCLMAIGFVALSCYLALARIHGSPLTGIALGLLAAFVTLGVYTGYVQGGLPASAVVAFAFVELALAAWLRTLCVRRWASVDWLEYKPAWGFSSLFSGSVMHRSAARG